MEKPTKKKLLVRDIVTLDEKALEAGRRAGRAAPPLSAATIRAIAPALRELRRRRPEDEDE